MAEIRKHDPDAGDGLGRLVREALGETVRPTTPGPAAASAGDAAHHPAADVPPAAQLPTWPSDGPAYTF